MDRIDESKLKPQRPSGPLRSRGARATMLAGALAVLSTGAYLGWQTWGSGESAALYTTAVAQRGDIEDSVTATGMLQPRDYVDVGTQVSGQLRKLHVKTGDDVKQGQLLAEIDPTVYLSRVDANRAQLRTQQAQLADREGQLATVGEDRLPLQKREALRYALLLVEYSRRHLTRSIHRQRPAAAERPPSRARIELIVNV